MENLHSKWLALKPLNRFDEYLPGVGRVAQLGRLHLEFGVWQGGSINYLANKLKPEKIYGFDSFQGLPEDWAMNNDGKNFHKKGHFATPLPKVRSNVELLVGMFDQTLPKFLTEHKGSIGYMNIDSDLYSSAKYVLTTLNDRITAGTVIRFDEICDWGGGVVRYDNWPDGEWKALLEWMKYFNREVEPISRTSALQGTIKVVK